MEYTFRYLYRAKENAEVLAIRKKYLPKSESKPEQMKRPEQSACPQKKRSLQNIWGLVRKKAQ